MIAAGRSEGRAAERRSPDEPGAVEVWIRRARTVASAPFLRLGWLLLHAGWLVGPPEEPVDAARRLAGNRFAPHVRQKVVASLEGELDDIIDDASAGRGMSYRAADALLVIVDILAWLRDGAEPPGWAATGLLEGRVALFNGARAEDEREMRRAFLDVLMLLLGEQIAGLRGGRLGQRRVDIESIEDLEARRFGSSLEKMRLSQELTVGELADGSGLDLIEVIGLLRGARKVSSAEVLVLADALGVDPGGILPDRFAAPSRTVADVVAEQDRGVEGYL